MPTKNQKLHLGATSTDVGRSVFSREKGFPFGVPN